MSLLQSWANSLALLTPRRLLALLSATLQSFATLYLHLWPYLLVGSLATATATWLTPTTPSHGTLLPLLLVGTVSMIVGSMLQIVILSALLPSSQPKNFAYYLHKIRTYWHLFLLPLLLVVLLMPAIIIITILAMLMIYIQSSRTPVWAQQPCVGPDCPASPPAADALTGIEAAPLSAAGQETITNYAFAISYPLGIFFYLAIIIFLESSPGLGSLTRALGKALKMMWRNLPFFLVITAMQIVPLLATGILQKIAMFSVLAPEMRALYSGVNALVLSPLVAALTVQIYKALHQQI